jgi:hypothetical protein
LIYFSLPASTVKTMSSSFGETLIERITRRHRAIVFGHRAILALGLKPTRLATEVWLDPSLSALDWIESAVGEVATADRAAIVRELGSVDLTQPGGERIHIFSRHPDLSQVSFEEAWEAGARISDNCRMACALDLLMTRLASPAEATMLEDAVLEELTLRLPSLPAEQALRLMERYAAPQSLFAARLSNHKEVREKARALLQEFSEQGDPFSADYLEHWDKSQ